MLCDNLGLLGKTLVAVSRLLTVTSVTLYTLGDSETDTDMCVPRFLHRLPVHSSAVGVAMTATNNSNQKYVINKYAKQKINNLKTEDEQIKKYLDLLNKNDTKSGQSPDDDDKNPPPSFNKDNIENIKDKIKEFEGIEKNGGVSFI